MLFLIDGYNVTRSDPATRTLSLEEQREALARRLSARGGSLLGAGRVVIVFDGAGGVGSVERIGQVEVRYSRGGQSADDAIVTAARGTTEGIVLVTSDNGLADRVRAHLGGSVSVRPREVCFENAPTPQQRRGRGGVARETGLPKGANRITEELKGLWLDSETDKDD